MVGGNLLYEVFKFKEHFLVEVWIINQFRWFFCFRKFVWIFGSTSFPSHPTSSWSTENRYVTLTWNFLGVEFIAFCHTNHLPIVISWFWFIIRVNFSNCVGMEGDESQDLYYATFVITNISPIYMFHIWTFFRIMQLSFLFQDWLVILYSCHFFHCVFYLCGYQVVQPVSWTISITSVT